MDMLPSNAAIKEDMPADQHRPELRQMPQGGLI
jgi:hypothetical protein